MDFGNICRHLVDVPTLSVWFNLSPDISDPFFWKHPEKICIIKRIVGTSKGTDAYLSCLLLAAALAGKGLKGSPKVLFKPPAWCCRCSLGWNSPLDVCRSFAFNVDYSLRAGIFSKVFHTFFWGWGQSLDVSIPSTQAPQTPSLELACRPLIQ